MSAPKFKALPDAIAAYLAGRSRRWAEVDGHQVDLHAAAHPCAVSRPGADERDPLVPGHAAGPLTREQHDHLAALCIAAELSQAVEVLPELAAPSEAARDVECCRACGRPMIGEVGR